MALLPRWVTAAVWLSTAAAAAAATNISVSPAIISDFPAVLTVVGSGFKVTNSNLSLCSVMSVDNAFVGYKYGPSGDYNPMKALQAHVINETHLTCETVRLNNPAPATVKVSMDGGQSWVGTSSSPSINIIPLVQVVVGRRPYTSEVEGQLIVKVVGPPLLPAGSSVVVSAVLPREVHPSPLVHGAAASTGTVSLLPFTLGGLPATVFAELTITVAFPPTAVLPHAAIRNYSKNFQRAPPPRNPNVTVVVVDHLTRGILLGRVDTHTDETAFLPFLPVGWFNSAFTYAAQGVSDHSFDPPPADVDPLLVAGAGRSVEWARKGVNLVRMGWRLPAELMLAELDHMHAAGLFAMISIPTPGHCNETAKPGKPARNCTADYEHMLGNMTLVREHPATWGYYICDDCEFIIVVSVVSCC
eukprot:COSAG05_NODE_622_length_8291_cov_19.484985_5_plen_415_part_00